MKGEEGKGRREEGGGRSKIHRQNWCSLCTLRAITLWFKSCRLHAGGKGCASQGFTANVGTGSVLSVSYRGGEDAGRRFTANVGAVGVGCRSEIYGQRWCRSKIHGQRWRSWCTLRVITPWFDAPGGGAGQIFQLVYSLCHRVRFPFCNLFS